jgi:hypothetical protein
VKELELQDQIRVAASSLGIVLWRNNVGQYRAGNRFVRYGLAVGSSDLIGIYRGRFVAIECKSERGRTTPHQDRFMDLVRRNGGYACVARSVEDVRAAVSEMDRLAGVL